MRLLERRLARLLALVLAVVLFAAACGDDDDDASGSGDETVVVTGSSTVEPISIEVADLLEASGSDVTVDVDGPGTGDGFVAFCAGEADITDASRPIAADEVPLCEDAGIEFIELEIGIDGLSVLTSADNADVTCLSFEDLYALIGPESEGFSDWSDAQDLATELGSDTQFPEAPLDLSGPGEESGTYDSFIEIAFGDIAEARLESGDITEEQEETTRPDYSASADDTVIIQGIEGSESSLGWVGFAFAEGAGDAVKEIEVDGGEGCVAPTSETIADGSYPLSRSLYIYVDAARAEDNPAVAEYVDYYLGEGIAAVETAGYVAVPQETLTQTQETWESRTTGTTDGG